MLRQASFLEFGFGDKGLFSALELVEMDGYALEEHFDLGGYFVDEGLLGLEEGGFGDEFEVLC